MNAARARTAATTTRHTSAKTAGTAPRKTAPTSEDHGKPTTEYTIIIPLDQVVGAATAIVKAPVNVARRVAPAASGLPVYLGLGGLAVVGIVEWPVAAAAGVGYAALRRWGPLRPGHDAAPQGASDAPKE